MWLALAYSKLEQSHNIVTAIAVLSAFMANLTAAILL